MSLSLAVAPSFQSIEGTLYQDSTRQTPPRRGGGARGTPGRTAGASLSTASCEMVNTSYEASLRQLRIKVTVRPSTSMSIAQGLRSS